MEQSQVCGAPSRTLSDDLSSVYDHINTYRTRSKADYERTHKNKRRNFAGTAATFLFILIGLIYAALYFLPLDTWVTDTGGIRLVLQFVVLLVYVLGGAAILFQYFSAKDLVKDFTGQIINIDARAANNDAALFEALTEHSVESIKYVADSLDHSSVKLGQLRAFLLGAIEKIGIIPGLLATVLAISKLANSTGSHWIEALSFLMLGIYMSMYPITEASIKTKQISVLLNQYLVLLRSNHETTNVK